MSFVALVDIKLIAAVLLTIVLVCASAHAETGIAGVNVVGVDLASTQTKDDLLRQLKRYGVTTVRTSLGGHGEGYTDFIIKANRLGISAVVFIGPNAGGTVKTHTLPPDKTAGRPWGIAALSDADPQEFTKWFGDELAKLEAAGVRVTAFELGNELNTPRFNADFGPDKIPGRVLGLRDLNNLGDGEGRQVAEGYRQYIKIMAALKAVRDHSSAWDNLCRQARRRLVDEGSMKRLPRGVWAMSIEGQKVVQSRPRAYCPARLPEAILADMERVFAQGH